MCYDRADVERLQLATVGTANDSVFVRTVEVAGSDQQKDCDGETLTGEVEFQVVESMDGMVKHIPLVIRREPDYVQWQKQLDELRKKASVIGWTEEDAAEALTLLELLKVNHQ